jgi:imidazoleglycerol phosphate dehydratase HisB
MAYTYHELKGKNVGDLREIAKGIQHEAVQGYTQLNKEHLLLALCKALNISTHEHHAVGEFDKSAVKAKMRSLRAALAPAVESGDDGKVKALRRQIHALNHDIRRHTATD